ncbi:(4Fe-4S)-binding protein [candidate division WOR-3 bacterium]|uniref:(4Fe-4S)-binding protein n=1 Tax=candidate division WOR-3 bacterium TaxID=2052148 RepID=A0A660SH81_UNCW3|nr:MAG: (4Fe-4S)-binding protein [candidate division WOR-3 bacterium]
MIIAVASGKGGTGKTTLATSLALSLENELTFLDCDVEEPNANFFLRVQVARKEEVSIPVPVVDHSRCDLCGRCSGVCVYNAIAVLPERVLVFEELCHGCGSCVFLCPKRAIVEKERMIGVIEAGSRGAIEFIQGRLNIKEPMATPLIRRMKRLVRKDRITIIDAPPGVSCPVIESVKGSDYTILVTEPTPFGLYDLKLAVAMLEELGIPHGIVINRDGIGDDSILQFAREKGISILASIPYDPEIAKVYARGGSLLNIMGLKDAVRKIFSEIL